MHSKVLPDSPLYIRQRLKDDLPHYAARCLKIRAKDGTLLPFRLNAAQHQLHHEIEAQRQKMGRVRVLILKARQWGCSTYVAGRFYHRLTHKRGFNAFLMAHQKEASESLFAIIERFHQHCPQPVRPHTGRANAAILSFDRLDGSFLVATAGGRSVGRSKTVNLFHGSEVAFWPKAPEHVAGALQAVPDLPETEVIFETTSAGPVGLFHDLWTAAQRGESEFINVFIPWHAHTPYHEAEPATPPISTAWQAYGKMHHLTPEQLHWAMRKNATLAGADSYADPEEGPCWAFRREYPACPEDAFLAIDDDRLIPPDILLRAETCRPEGVDHSPLIFGVDIARGGNDKTRMIDRQGRALGFKLNLTLDSRDLMAIAGRLAREIDSLRPDAVFIEITGIGAGVYDRLRERGYRRLHPIHPGSRAEEQERYFNKRAECWGRMAAWVADPAGVHIITDSELRRQMSAPRALYDSAGRLKLESKDQIRPRLGSSPDGADAAALTFAERISRPFPRGWSPRARLDYTLFPRAETI